MQDEDRALLRTKTPEPTLEGVAVGDLAALVGHDGRGHRGEIDLDRPTPAATDDVERCVDGQTMQPIVDTVRVAQAREVPPRSDVRILDCITGKLGVSQDQARDRFEPRDRPPTSWAKAS